MDQNSGMNRPNKCKNDPHDSLANIHLDVHGIRKDIRDAIEKSQTALLNALSALASKVDRIEMKIDKLNIPAPGGEVVTEADKAIARDIRDLAQSTKSQVNALDDQTPNAA